MLLILGLARAPQAYGGWKAKSPMPKARYGLCAVALGDSIYVIGGRGDHGEVFSTVMRFNPREDRWDTLAAGMREPRYNAAAVALNGKIYVLGGRQSPTRVSKKVEVYLPSANRWQTVREMHEEREGLAAAVLDSQIYVFGGTDEHGDFISDVERYDPRRDEWKEFEGALPLPRAALTAVGAGDFIYLLGGFFGGPLGLAQRTDRELHWESFPSLIRPRGNAAAAALSDTLFVVGGIGVSGVLASAELYLPSEGRWREVEPMSITREGLAAAAVRGKVYVFGGRSAMPPHSPALNLVEEYTPTSTAVANRQTPTPIDFGPGRAGLEQNYPNPFNAQTVISYQWSGVSDQSATKYVTLKIYDVLGREVRTLVDELQKPGSYRVTWDGRDRQGNVVASGLYFYSLRAGDLTLTRKMILIP